jgi:hypothetical protein
MFAGRRRGTAEPRWRWSGVAPLTAAQLSLSDMDLETLLPDHQSPIARIVLALRDLGRKYHRYLHQDELGPTRAERMAALRLLLDQLGLLLSQLNGLPEPLRLQISKRLGCNPNPVERDIDNFQTHCNDVEAVQLVGEAALDDGLMLHAESLTCDAERMDDLGGVAEKTVQLLSALDTTTAAALAIDTEFPNLQIEGGAANNLIDLAIARARIGRLQHCAERTLARLEGQKGPERCESLRWLVWQLCDLYHYETRQQVTSSPHVKKRYEAIPQSQAGNFVLKAVNALQPPESWTQEPDHLVARRRARILDGNSLSRAVYYAMREYVSYHPSKNRRGRRKAK